MTLFSQIYSKSVKIITRANVDSIFRQIIIAAIFETITKEFSGVTIHAIIINGKIKNKINCNVDWYYAKEKDIDTESLNLKTLIRAYNLIINNKTRSLNVFTQC